MLSDLRFARFWLVFGWISVVVALYYNLAPASDLKLPNWNDKVEHFLGYFLLTSWFCGIYPRRNYWRIGLALLGMGILVEILQGLMHMGRHAEVMDVVADIGGIIPALLLALTPLSHWPRWLEALIPGK